MRQRGLVWFTLWVAASCSSGAFEVPEEPDSVVVRPGMPVVSIPAEGERITIGWASSLAVSEHGIAVADRVEHRVLVFDTLGRLERELGRHGRGPGEMISPERVKWADDGSLWILDTGMMRLSLFGPDGRFVESHQVPARDFAPLQEGAFVFPIGDPSSPVAWVDQGRTTAVRVGEDLFRKSRRRAPDAPIRHVLVAAGHGGLVALVDNVEGAVFVSSNEWRRPRSSAQDFRELLVPGRVSEWATERQERRTGALDIGPGVNPLIPRYQSVHMTRASGLWLSTGWSDLLGVLLPIDGLSTSATFVAPGANEFVGMVDSALLGTSKLVILYATGARIYPLSLNDLPLSQGDSSSG